MSLLQLSWIHWLIKTYYFLYAAIDKTTNLEYSHVMRDSVSLINIIMFCGYFQ